MNVEKQTNMYGREAKDHKYGDFIGKHVTMYTSDGPMYGVLKNIVTENYTMSPFLDTQISDNLNPESFMNSNERSYSKMYVRGIEENSKKSIENLVRYKNRENMNNNYGKSQ